MPFTPIKYRRFQVAGLNHKFGTSRSQAMAVRVHMAYCYSNWISLEE